MIVAIHQPNFMPWLGYFYKMAKADCFVFHDKVALADRSFTNRVKIKTAAGAEWAGVSVMAESRGGPIVQAVCSDTAQWRRKIPIALDVNYRKAPYFKEYGPAICEKIASGPSGLAELNISLIQHIAAILGLQTPTRRSSQMAATGNGNDLNIALCKELGADTYLSGTGAGNTYQEDAAFTAAGLKLVYSDFQHPVYPQQFGPFEPNLSILDLLFNCGPDSGAILSNARKPSCG
jgi:hypothetical protein